MIGIFNISLIVTIIFLAQTNAYYFSQWLTPAFGAVLIVAQMYQARQAALALKIAKDTHTLVNSRYGQLLGVAYAALRKEAIRTGAPADLKAADEALQELLNHQKKQGVVDSVDAPKDTEN